MIAAAVAGLFGPAFATPAKGEPASPSSVTKLLRDLLRTNTTNPPGNESMAAAVLARALRRAGIASEIFESAPGRGNLVARVRGDGSERPIILLSHLDVVPATPKEWQHDPFSGDLVDGYVHGRGALDCKGMTAMQAGVAIALATTGARLRRDLILVATADEEAGGRAGAGWLTRAHPELFRDAEFLLTEGDNVHQAVDGSLLVQIAIAEKTPNWLEITANGTGGHGSTPRPETAVTRLLDALGKLRGLNPSVHVTPAVATYFASLAPLRPEPLRSRLAALEASLGDDAFRTEFLANPRQNALVRNTCTPTVLDASPKTNVIPATARAQIDCRMLPGEDPAAFVEQIRRMIASEEVTVTPILSFPASSSAPDSAVVRAVRQLSRQEFGDAPVIPSVIPGFTDSHYFRELGIASYGFAPLILTEADERTVHGADERIAVENVELGVRRMLTLLRLIDEPHADLR